MIKKTAFVILLTTVICLNMISWARAECAWVLWVKTELQSFPKDKAPRQEVSWELNSAAPRNAQCEQMKSILLQKMIQYYKANSPGAAVETTPYGLITIRVADDSGNPISTTVESYHCFPDTIDPRKK